MPKEITTKDYSTKTLKTLHSASVLHVEESEELKPVDKEAIDKHWHLRDNHLIKSTHENLAIFVGTWQMQKLNLSGVPKKSPDFLGLT